MPTFMFTDQWVPFSVALENAARDRINSIIEDVCAELLQADVCQDNVDEIKGNLRARYANKGTAQSLVKGGSVPDFRRKVWSDAIKAATTLENDGQEEIP